MPATSPIYERQMMLAGARTCGAAALSMVYRSLGHICNQAEIWTRLCKAGRTLGGIRTYLLAADALSQHLSAAVVQAEAPWELLEVCHAAGIEVILNHRVTIQSPWGHYSVLQAINPHTAWLHDPQFGPHRPLPRDELLSLWQRGAQRSEVSGNVAVLVALPPASAIESAASLCPNCAQTIPFDLLSRLRQDSGTSPIIRRVHCPGCDWAISPGSAS